MVGTVTRPAAFAVNQWVGEASNVPARLPQLRILNDGAIDAENVVLLLHYLAPPELFEIIREFDTEWSVIIEARQAAVDFARRKYEAATLGERDYLLHQLRISHINILRVRQKAAGCKAWESDFWRRTSSTTEEIDGTHN